MLKVGIIGAGGVARAHARALNTLKSAELVGVLDIDARAAESFTDAYGGTRSPMSMRCWNWPMPS